MKCHVSVYLILMEKKTKATKFLQKKELTPGADVKDYLYEKKHVRYYGDFFMHIALSDDGKKWLDSKCDYNPIAVMGVFTTPKGILVIYNSPSQLDKVTKIKVGMALFDLKNPMNLLWRSAEPVFEKEVKTTKYINSGEAKKVKDEIVLSWKLGPLEKIKAKIPCPYFCFEEKHKKEVRKLSVKKHTENPIIKPREENAWESKATFNPAAIYIGGKVHLLYRAIGHSDMSVLGYVSSEDGINITERLSYPIYSKPNMTAEKREGVKPVLYTSGGSWNGGCEDPRITLIEGKIYLSYTAFDGWGSIRIGLSSISMRDFLQQKWNWKEPVLISKPGEMHKNWIIFPEKIKGKYAVLHTLRPNILIDYVDDLDSLGEGNYINSVPGLRVAPKGCENLWLRASGAPPIKTKEGWLLICHVMDVRDPNKYKLGAILLDLDNPEKIIAISNYPILEPEEDYENNGLKHGVAFCCGAIVKDEKLFIYYGGSDTYSCVASVDLNKFLKKLIKNNQIKK